MLLKPMKATVSSSPKINTLVRGESMQEAFDKLMGVDIFSLKIYMEPIGYVSFNGACSSMNFCQSSFLILNAVVGFSLCSSES